MCYGVPVIVTRRTAASIRGWGHRARGQFQTKAIIVNSPNNPSGVVYGEEFIAKIIDFCERKKIYVIMDDIYHKLVFDGNGRRRRTSSRRRNSRTLASSSQRDRQAVRHDRFRIGWSVAAAQDGRVMTNVQRRRRVQFAREQAGTRVR